MGSAASIRNRLSTNSRYGEAKDYLSLVSDEELEKNYRLTKEAYDVAKIKNNFFPYNDSYPDAMAASISLRDLGNKEGEKLLYSIAHTSINTEPQKATSQVVKNTSSTVDTSIFDLSNTNNPPTNYKYTSDAQNRNNTLRQENKYADEKKSESSASSAAESEDVTWVSDFSKEKTESGIVVQEAAYLVLDLACYNAAKLDGLEDRDWMNLSIGYDLYYKNGKNIDKKDFSAENIAIKNTLKSWNKEEIYKFEGLDMAVYSKMIGGKKHVVVVNAGSENPFKIAQRTEEVLYDWSDNAARFVGSTNDVEKSIEYAKKIVDKYKDANITFVGYSKGGAEAAANAMATGKDAVLFNPAVPRNLHKYGIDGEYKGNMVTYIVSGEILSETEGRGSDVLPGKKKYVGKKQSLWNDFGTITQDFLSDLHIYNMFEKMHEYAKKFGTELRESINLHSMENFK